MRHFIKFVMISIMVMFMVSCSCNRGRTETPSQTDTTDVLGTPSQVDTMDVVGMPPLEYELQTAESFYSPDSTKHFTLLKGCIIYVTHEDNPVVYDLLNKDMLNDNEDYKSVLVRMGYINDSTEVVGYMNANVFAKHKRLR